MKWVQKQLIPNLPANSILVIDNASYHNVKFDKEPTSSSLKKDMLQWLNIKNIPYEDNLTKVELYKLIKLNKVAQPQYKLDMLLSEFGHQVLRLPPYHPELNSIEKIWAAVKNWVATRNVEFKLGHVEQLTRQRFQELTQEEWINICNHTKNVEQTYLSTEHLLDDAIDTIEFSVNTNSSDEEYSNSSCESDDVEML